jgi:hypothetical protein
MIVYIYLISKAQFYLSDEILSNNKKIETYLIGENL